MISGPLIFPLWSFLLSIFTLCIAQLLQCLFSHKVYLPPSIYDYTFSLNYCIYCPAVKTCFQVFFSFPCPTQTCCCEQWDWRMWHFALFPLINKWNALSVRHDWKSASSMQGTISMLRIIPGCHNQRCRLLYRKLYNIKISLKWQE